MPEAVRFDSYGDVEVLKVVDVPQPVPATGQVLVRVVAAAINPGEAAIRSGVLHERWPASFPSGQGSDLAGVVAAVGDGVRSVAVGDEVLGFTDWRASHAEYVLTEETDVIPKPASVSWDAAASLYVAGTTAYAAVRAVAATVGDTVAVAGAAGGVGSLTVQLLLLRGARVLGLAGPDTQDWLRELGAEPIVYGDGVEDRIRAAAPDGVDAFIDLFGADYVELALALGVAPDRIDTVTNFAAVQKYGVKAEGNAEAGNSTVLAELAALVADGDLTVPIAATFPLGQVQDAYRLLEQRHSRGKIVLRVAE